MGLTFHLPPKLFAIPPPSAGPQTNWKASGKFPFVWLGNTVQILVFVGTDHLETIVSREESAKSQEEGGDVSALLTRPLVISLFFTELIGWGAILTNFGTTPLPFFPFKNEWLTTIGLRPWAIIKKS